MKKSPLECTSGRKGKKKKMKRKFFIYKMTFFCKTAKKRVPAMGNSMLFEGTCVLRKIQC